MNEDLKKEASEYSFNINSQLYDTLPVEYKAQWREEVERHYLNGRLTTLANIWHSPDELPKDGERIVIYLKNGSLRIGKYYNNEYDWSEKYVETSLFGLIKREVRYKLDVVKWCYCSDIDL